MPSLTHPRLREIAAYLDSVRAQLAALLDAALRASPHPAPMRTAPDGRWNGAQIVQHLGKVEGATVKMLEGLLGTSRSAGIPADAGTTSLLHSLDRFLAGGEGLRPLVAPERFRPAPDADLEASWASLVTVRERTYRAYATVDGSDLTTISAPHPLFGPLNAYEWLLFLGMHEERHVGQLRRQLAASA